MIGQTIRPKKKRIIINYSEDIEDDLATDRVMQILSKGKISGKGKSYCYLTKYYDGILVSTKEPNSTGTITFNLWKENIE